MNKNRTVQLVAILITLTALVLASLVTPKIDDQRLELQLSGNPQLDSTAPPEVVLATSALGSFRGLAVNFFWYRIERLKQEGKLAEANSLANAITTLQPRFPRVWQFQAWNMAYNLSVITHTSDERWDWVNRGIELLRAKGIPMNPTSVLLYKELSWIFSHKIGQFADEYHWYYKRQLAHEWQQVLGTPPLGGEPEEFLEAFRPVAEAPESLDQLLAESPEVHALIEKFAQLGYKADSELLLQIGGLELFRRVHEDGVYMNREAANEYARYDKDLLPIINDPENEASLGKLLSYLRKRILKKKYHMDAQYMFAMMDGTKLMPDDPMIVPIDWRHWGAHTAYWGLLGVERMIDARIKEDVDQLNTDRQVIHAMQAMMFYGRISYDAIDGHITVLPDPSFIEPYERVWLIATERARSDVYHRQTEADFKNGHENFLMTAMLFEYLYGDVESAKAYYDRARRLYGLLPNGEMGGRYTMAMEETILNELDMDRLASRRQFADSMLTRSFEQGLANNRMDVFARFVKLAKDVYDKYHTAESNIDPANAITDLTRGFWAQTFEKSVNDSYIAYMQQGQVPLIQRSRIWRNAPLPMRLASYDRISGQLNRQCRQAGFNPDIAFPVPPGLEEYRKLNPSQKSQQDNVNIQAIERK